MYEKKFMCAIKMDDEKSSEADLEAASIFEAGKAIEMVENFIAPRVKYINRSAYPYYLKNINELMIKELKHFAHRSSIFSGGIIHKDTQERVKSATVLFANNCRFSHLNSTLISLLQEKTVRILATSESRTWLPLISDTLNLPVTHYTVYSTNKKKMEMEADKPLEEEEEEEKEHFFSDIVSRNRENEPDEDDEDELMEDIQGEPMNTNATPGTTNDHERRAQVGASPYIAPYTPLSSPNKIKSPGSAAPRGVSKKPQLVPIKNESSSSGRQGANPPGKLIPEDIIGHLPSELVEALTLTIQNLDKMILCVENFKTDQIGTLTEKVNIYIDLLKKVDAYGSNYHAMIPIQVLE
jgi:hypothetical protein